jgi:YEATS domain-containing protein 1/3
MAAAAAEKMEPPPSKMAKKEKTTNVVEQNYFKNGESTSNAEDTANIFHDSSNKSVAPPLGGSLPPEKQLTVDYLTELKSLQHKIMTLQDNNELQQVVEMIAATGQYEITQKTFDFDLCALDRHTVQRLQDFFASNNAAGVTAASATTCS